MTLQKAIDILADNWGSYVTVFVLISSVIEIVPIKINPISWIMGWLGRHLNKDVNDRLDELEKKLDAHIEESNEKDIRDRRTYILDFANSCMNDRKHTQEEFEYVIRECDKYEKYCKDNDILNGVAEDAIKEIHRIYTKCRQENSFLIGGVGDEC